MLTIYPSLGKCIYCRKEGVDLTDEHIIPLSLQGFLVFDDASCVPCARLTNKFESRVIQSLEHFRVRYNVNTRNPADRKKKIFFFWSKQADGTKKRVAIPHSELPATAMLYKFGRANILQGWPPDTPIFEWLPVPYSDGIALKAAMDKYGWDGSLQFKTIPNEFAQMLAKIGHSYAIAELSKVLGGRAFDSFVPLCVDIILGNAKNYSYVVGGSLELKKEADSTSDHFIGLGFIQQPWRPKLLVVTVRLFQQMGTPHHHIVVGRVETDAQVRLVEEYFSDSATVQQSFHGI